MLTALSDRVAAFRESLKGDSLLRRSLWNMFRLGMVFVPVKLLTFSREVVIARQYGVGALLDAYLVALGLMTLLGTLVTDSLASSFVPVFTRLRDDDQHTARAFVGLLALLLGSASSLAAGLVGLFAPQLTRLLVPGFGASSQALAQSLLLVLRPYLVLFVLNQFFVIVLNTLQHYTLATLTGGITPLMVIGSLLTVRADGFAQAQAVNLGMLIEVALLAVFLSVLRLWRLPDLSTRIPLLGTFWRQYGFLMITMTLSTCLPLIDQWFASRLGPGSIAALSYGNKLTGFGLVLVLSVMRTVMLPALSSAVHREQWQTAYQLLRRLGRLFLLGGLGIACLISLISLPLVSAVFSGGHFTAQDAISVARLQAIYALQIPLVLFGTLFVQFISSTLKNDFFVSLAVVNLMMNLTMDVLFVRLFGLVGIPLSTVAVYGLSAILLNAYAWRILRAKFPASAPLTQA
jgi:putative peptidoglycan lipid II flippase